MVSSLAAQLAKSTSLNTSLLVDRSRRKPTQSYLFASREADQHDLDSIHALGVNGFLSLKSLEPTLGVCGEPLFSDAAKVTDRTLLSAAANATLDRNIGAFLPLLGPYLLEAPTGKVIEWMVRRFRIHEFNVDAVLALFLPYHESPHFAKMLSILTIAETSPFAPLLPFKSTSTPLSRSALVNIMLQPGNTDFSRFIASLLHASLRSDALVGIHRCLITFHTSTLLEFLKNNHAKVKRSAIDEATIAWLLPAAMEPLQVCADVKADPSKEAMIAEAVLSSYLLLCALCHVCPLSTEALSAITKAIVSCAPRVSANHALKTAVSVCAGQEAVDPKIISKTVVKAILKLNNLPNIIKELLIFEGPEKFLSPLLSAFVQRLHDGAAFDVANSLVTDPHVPQAVICQITTDLIRRLVNNEQSNEGDQEHRAIADVQARALLVHIQQRHPLQLQKSFETAMKEDEEHREAVEQLLLSLSVDMSMVTRGSDEHDRDMVLASTNSDSSVRQIAVRSLYSRLSDGKLDASELASVHSALLARVQDTSVPVLEALYSSPAQLLPILLADAAAYVSTISRVLHPPSAPSKNLIRAHLSFVATHFCKAVWDQDSLRHLTSQFFHEIFVPFLLYSKPRQKTATMVWEIIGASEQEAGGIGRYELLGGCVDAIRWQEAHVSEGQQTDGPHSLELMAKANLTMAAKMAENIMTSNSFAEHFDAFVAKLQDANPHPRVLSLLVLRALLSYLSGEHQINAALRVLQSMGLSRLDGIDDFMLGGDDPRLYLNDASLGSAVVSKPSSRSTLHRLQISILSILPTILRPSGVNLNWLVDTSAVNEGADKRAIQYVQLLRTLYTLANLSSSLPLLSTHLVRALFINLGDDALAFLAGIWLDSNTATELSSVRYAALRHAAAFLEAHFTAKHWIDFQTILPAILVALQSSQRRVRESAVECVTVLLRLTEPKQPTAIYAFDAIYAADSSNLQYLEWADFCRYLHALGSIRDHIRNDSSYLRVFHQQNLAKVATQSKKEAGYKQRILCYLLSHVNACKLPAVKIALLKSVEAVSSPVKLQMLLPDLQSLTIEEPAQHVRLGLHHEEFYTLAISSIDESVANDLNAQDGSSWMVYLEVLRLYYKNGAAATIRSVLAQQLRKGLFASLSLERKVELCHLFLELGQESPELSIECRNLLASMLNEVPVIVRLLVSLQPAASDGSQRASKRARLDDSSNKDVYSSLSLLAEVLGAQSLPGSLELVSCLLEVLTKVVHDSSPAPADKIYVEQLLMSALENVAANIPEMKSLTPTAIRLDILVELIRVSDNPQTFHQALLLMASLTRLAPDAVLHNVMPVFTFMGSNVFQRDDTYSFRVVQKTVDSIVPVMVSSLKNTHADRVDLYIASRPFLRIFTDAANHIPRHRRTSFFSHLVDVLGPDEFLAPICLLLIDKMSSRVVRQSSEDSFSSLSLSLTIFQRHPSILKLSSTVELLRETCRLIESELDPSIKHNIFLETSSDEERNTQSVIARRRAQAILIFIGHALQHQTFVNVSKTNAGQPPNSEILSLLLDIAVTKGERLSKLGMNDVAKSAQMVIGKALASMPATDFVGGVLTVLNSGEFSLQKGALDLLGDQLRNVADDVRHAVTKTIVKIVDVIRTVLTSKPDHSLVEAALHALKSISLTTCSGEESALTSSVPLVLKTIQEKTAIASAMSVMLILIQKLGPRIIPSFRSIVKECVAVLRTGSEAKNAGTKELVSDVLDVLRALLSSIPNFWSAVELRQVIEVYLDNCTAGSKTALATQMSTFMKALSKRAQPKLLLGTLSDIWPSAASGQEDGYPRLPGFFNVVKKTVHAAPRPVVMEQVRSLFKIHLDAFELCASTPTILDTLKSELLPAFLELVVKLNEATFKPLFRKLFDWAFASEKAFDGPSRSIVFCHVYIALLDFFKGLMTPYMSFLLQPFVNFLGGFENSGDKDLWLVIVQTLTQSFVHDDGVFWRDDKLRQLHSPLVAQVAVWAQLNLPEGKAALSDCLIGLAGLANDDAILKSLNLNILMHTRSEDVRLRLYALHCSEALWEAHGGKLLGFVPETTTFIAECAEDENDSVVREAHRLKDAVERLAGKIDV